MHCRFFQDSSVNEQEHLLRHVATLYVKMLSLRSLEAHRDFFFKYYPYVLANAIFWGFYYLCPGSRHLYTNGFKRILYLQLAQILTGMDVCPSSVQVLRQQVFPEETADDEGEEADSLPPLPMHSGNADKNLRNAASNIEVGPGSQEAKVLHPTASAPAILGAGGLPAATANGGGGGDADTLATTTDSEHTLDPTHGLQHGSSATSLLAGKKGRTASATSLLSTKHGPRGGSPHGARAPHPVACWVGRNRVRLHFNMPWTAVSGS